MQQLEYISAKILEYYMIDVPDTAVLGTSAYASLLKEFAQHGAPTSAHGRTTLQVYTCAANLRILVSNKVKPDHISIGTIGKETFKLLETFARLGIEHEDPFVYGFTH